MADVAIRASATAAAPRDYTIPGAQEILPKAIAASMDGSAAAVSWFPALQVLDPGGNVMFTAISDVNVVAGASADVSWFPGVKQGGGSNLEVTDGTTSLFGIDDIFFTSGGVVSSGGVGVADVAIGGAPGLPHVNVYAAGVSTWNKPAGVTVVEVLCIGSGGGGGGGSDGAGLGTASGGAGGGGGAVVRSIMAASDVPASATVTVASGGSGGAGGNPAVNGSDGANTTFGSLVLAGGGGGGIRGRGAISAQSGAGGNATGSAVNQNPLSPSSGASDAIGGQAANTADVADGHKSEWGGASGGSSTNGIGSGPWNGGGSLFAGPGGGGGGAVSTTTGQNGGSGGTKGYAGGGGGTAGTGGAATTAGGNGTFVGPYCGSAGGGGGSGNSGVNGKNGGNGALGAGGGGGGSSAVGSGGRGGNGGDGRCIVFSY